MIKKFIAIIPARGGSKRIKNKNIILFKKKPLIFWTIDVAIKSKIFNKIFISTDSKKIKQKLKRYKNKISFLNRPKKLSGNKTKTKTLIKFLINKNKLNKRYSDFMLLQPTSPLRTKKNIIDMWKFYLKNNLDNLISVSSKKNNHKIYNKKNNIYSKSKKVNKKEIYLNGSIYIYKIDEYLKRQNSNNIGYNFYFIPAKYSFDLDTIEQLKSYNL